MKVYKFGGASIKSAAAIKNVGDIICSQPPEVIVFSALGKMTNNFERLSNDYYHGRDVNDRLALIVSEHIAIMDELFDAGDPVYQHIDLHLHELRHILSSPHHRNYDQIYDQIVSFGEILSSTILSYYLQHIGVDNMLLPAAEWLVTDDLYRGANVYFLPSQKNLQNYKREGKIIVTQGFIGRSISGKMTTLGREGSDYSAALAGAMLNADSVTVWKDVPGLLNADPRFFSQGKLLSHISYEEAVELAFCGLKAIHPKTIMPLENHNIPLWVKSFVDPIQRGTLIDGKKDWDEKITSYIIREDQILLSLRSKDFSLFSLSMLSDLYASFLKRRLPINLLQRSAITMHICVDDVMPHLNDIIEELAETFRVDYERDVTLFTVRHCGDIIKDITIQEYLNGRTLLLEQLDMTNRQWVLK